MDEKDQHERGLKLRINMFGREAVEKRMSAFGEFGKPLQHIINAYAYGDVWSRTALPPALGGEVAAEHGARPAPQLEEPGQEVQQARLARAVRAEHRNHGALLHVEVNAGERRVATEQRDGRSEDDDECHGAERAYF